MLLEGGVGEVYTMHNMPSSLSASVAGVCPHAFREGGWGVYLMHNMPSLLSASVACLHALFWGGGGGGCTQCTVCLVYCPPV